jgi:hypothetical protein
MISFNKPILLRVMRIADEHSYSERLTKAYKGSGKVAALWRSDESRVSRSNVIEAGKPCEAKVCARAWSAVSAVKSDRT